MIIEDMAYITPVIRESPPLIQAEGRLKAANLSDAVSSPRSFYSSWSVAKRQLSRCLSFQPMGTDRPVLYFHARKAVNSPKPTSSIRY
jgi:hypothetical protein